MPDLPSLRIQALSYTFAYHLRRGLSASEASALVRSTHPGFTVPEYYEALALGGRAYDTARAADLLPPDRPLSDALYGWDPPASTVRVSVLVSGTQTDAAGHTSTWYRTVVVNAPWSMTRGALDDVALAAAVEWIEKYDMTEVETSITGGMYFPPYG